LSFIISFIIAITSQKAKEKEEIQKIEKELILIKCELERKLLPVEYFVDTLKY